MTKAEIAAVALSGIAAIGSVVAAVQANQAGAGVAILAERVVKLESAAPAGTPSAAPSTATADLQRELAALKSQVASLEARQVASSQAPAKAAPADPAAAEEAARKAKLAEESRQKVWLETYSRRIVEALSARLELTAQQESQVREILATQLVEYRQARLGSSAEDTKKSVDALTADTNAKVKAVLTTEQQAKFEEIAGRPGGIFAIPGTFGGARKDGTTTEAAPNK